MSRALDLVRDALHAAGGLFDRALGFDLDLTVTAFLLLGAVSVALLSARPDGRSAGVTRVVLRVAMTITVVVMLALTLQARPIETSGVNLVPGRSFALYLQDGVDIVLAVRNLVFNVLLFVPFGFLRVLQRAVAGRRWVVTRVGLESLVFCVGIELAQYLVPLGRVADVDDVLTNTLGGVLGALAGWALVGVGRQASAVVDARRAPFMGGAHTAGPAGLSGEPRPAAW